MFFPVAQFQHNHGLSTSRSVAVHSSKFEISNASYSSKVLNGKGMMILLGLEVDRFVSDTIHAEMSNGMSVNGKDSFMSGIQSYWAMFIAVRSAVVACMVVKTLINITVLF